jgi:hypothetical protein
MGILRDADAAGPDRRTVRSAHRIYGALVLTFQ